MFFKEITANTRHKSAVSQRGQSPEELGRSHLKWGSPSLCGHSGAGMCGDYTAMKEQCWVNNHAHILKAKSGYDQGFISYSLAHTNILSSLASGTWAKLNRSELNKIEVLFSSDPEDQKLTTAILSDMDTEIDALEHRRVKTAALKQAVMQELLTGRTRLT